MIENTSYITCKPSQLLNLGNFLPVLVLIPALFLPDELVRQVLPVSYLPEKLAVHLFRLPVYLAVMAGLNLGYHILRIRCIRYEITPEELKHYSGILNRKHEFIELYRVKGAHVKGAIVNIQAAKYLASVRKASHPSAYP